MNNVVQLNLELHKPQSPIMFTAVERPLFFTARERQYDADHKALVRYKDDDHPILLNVVRNTYKMVQNHELFTQVENGLRSQLSRSEYERAEVYDHMAYGGATCMREYRFPDISVSSPDNDKIMFRVIASNGFGTGSLKVFGGAIDMFCTNGMIIGQFVRAYAKHTSGVKISKFDTVVRGAVDMFWKNATFWGKMASMKVMDDDRVFKWLEHRFGERLAKKLMHQYRIECQSRGRSIWALYSALTYYASHADGEFSLRNTKNDHAAATMLKREEQVRNVSHDLITELAA